MTASEKAVKWAMRFYPPLFFQRIWVKKIEKGFSGVHIKIFKSIFNINYNKSIFGGTIFSAADPFYAVCFHQLLQRKGYPVQVWTKSADIRFIKPAYTSLSFSIHISAEEVAAISHELDITGKCSRHYPLEILNAKGELCASVTSEVHIRKIEKQSVVK